MNQQDKIDLFQDKYQPQSYSTVTKSILKGSKIERPQEEDPDKTSAQSPDTRPLAPHTVSFDITDV